MAIRAHIDWTGRSKEILSLGQIHDIPYSLRLGELLQQAAGKIGYPLAMGVYAQVTGPCYETPAEIQALAKLGADAVGMSTAVEMETGCRLGLECAAISCVTNHAAGVAAGPIQHSEVLASAKMLESPLGNLLEAFLDLL
jgi:purine-nucleoside phosphorylase